MIVDQQSGRVVAITERTGRPGLSLDEVEGMADPRVVALPRHSSGGSHSSSARHTSFRRRWVASA